MEGACGSFRSDDHTYPFLSHDKAEEPEASQPSKLLLSDLGAREIPAGFKLVTSFSPQHRVLVPDRTRS
jgi:hypothetical protein